DDRVWSVHALASEPVRARELSARALLSRDQLEEGLASLSHAGEWYFAPEWLEQTAREARTRLALRAEATPLDPGLSTSELLPGAPWADAVLPLLDVERRNGKVFLRGAAAGLGERENEAAALEARLRESGLTPVPVDDAELARFLEESGRLVRIGAGSAIGKEAYDGAKRA